MQECGAPTKPSAFVPYPPSTVVRTLEVSKHKPKRLYLLVLPGKMISRGWATWTFFLCCLWSQHATQPIKASPALIFFVSDEPIDSGLHFAWLVRTVSNPCSASLHLSACSAIKRPRSTASRFCVVSRRRYAGQQPYRGR